MFESSLSREDGSGGTPILARDLGIVFENSPETARVRAEACRVWFFATVRPPPFGEAGDGDPAPRRSRDGTDRSLGLRKSPPERLSRDGFARRGTFRTAGAVAAGAGMEDALLAPDAEDRTGRREVGRGSPLRRGICRRSSILGLSSLVGCRGRELLLESVFDNGVGNCCVQ